MASFVIDSEQAHARTLEFFSSARKRDAFGNRSWERNVRFIGKTENERWLGSGLQGDATASVQLQRSCAGAVPSH